MRQVAVADAARLRGRIDAYSRPESSTSEWFQDDMYTEKIRYIPFTNAISVNEKYFLSLQTHENNTHTNFKP